jgi:hypothetical protein
MTIICDPAIGIYISVVVSVLLVISVFFTVSALMILADIRDAMQFDDDEPGTGEAA